MKKAVILFNLGGPDKLENVEPFLFNLFNDPAILNLPSFISREITGLSHFSNLSLANYPFSNWNNDLLLTLKND